MKKLMTLTLCLLLGTAMMAQKTKNKEKAVKHAPGKTASAPQKKTAKQHDAIWEGTADKDGGPKPSKNQPAKVRAAFQSDYPNATGVTWNKYRGDWTASFRNGLTRSTAVYHANGQRKDTRTLVDKPSLPKVIIEEILKKRPGSILEDIIRIQVPGIKDIFRIKSIQASSPQFLFYGADGKEVKYDY